MHRALERALLLSLNRPLGAAATATGGGTETAAAPPKPAAPSTAAVVAPAGHAMISKANEAAPMTSAAATSAAAPTVTGPVVLQVSLVRGNQYYGYRPDEQVYLKVHLYVAA